MSGAPETLYHLGASLTKLLERPSVTIVGTRNITPYGRQVVDHFAKGLAEQGIVVVSGLALGVDAYAHEAALETGGLCIAVLPCSLDNIVPVRNRDLAAQIIKQGGALISEYAPGQLPFRQNFIARNRIMSGLSQATLIIEAAAKSGALHTAKFALDQGKTVLAVPGNIFNNSSAGTNKLIKCGEAGAVTDYRDVLNAVGVVEHLSKKPKLKGRNAHEQVILDLMYAGMTDADKILDTSNLDVSEFAQAFTMLEIECKIRPLGYNHWTIY